MKLPLLIAGFAISLLGADSSDWIAHLGGKVERDTTGNIVSVNLRGSWINDIEMLELARLPYLQKLDLSHTRISDEGMLRLKAAPRIADLNLFYSEWITDQGLAAIKGWKHLKRLNLRGTRISDGTLEIASGLSGLEALDVANTQVTDNGLDYLITLINLKELAIGSGRLGDSAQRLLGMLPTLTYLDLSGARATRPDTPNRRAGGGLMSEGMVRSLAELPELRTLKLGYSMISAEGLQILSALEKVERLGLQACTGVDDTAAMELANWKSLKYVDLQDTRVTQQGVEALRKAKPGLTVLFNPAKS